MSPAKELLLAFLAVLLLSLGCHSFFLTNEELCAWRCGSRGYVYDYDYGERSPCMSVPNRPASCVCGPQPDGGVK